VKQKKLWHDAMRVLVARFPYGSYGYCHGVVVDKTMGLLKLGAIGVVVIGRHKDSFGSLSWGSFG
jgi:hypothetical protein